MSNECCFNCFSPLNGAPVCQRCGFDNVAYTPQPHHLRHGVILKNRYVVGRALGQSGFGITYAGYDMTLQVRVAVKEYFPSGLVWRESVRTSVVSCYTSENFQKSFAAGIRKCVNEAQSLARLDDIPNIVRVKDYFEENNTAYIIMEFVKGVTLAAYLKKLTKKPDYRQAVELLAPVAEALAQVHSRGFVHRDVSPDNIMITKSGTPKLLDFGAVKTVVEGGSATETLIIKRGFSPVEMYFSGGKIGPWSDVYAYCATLYYMITGKRMEEPKQTEEDEDDTAAAALSPLLAPAQTAALLKGLEYAPKNRYRTIPEMTAALNACKGGGNPPPPPPPPPKPDDEAVKKTVVLKKHDDEKKTTDDAKGGAAIKKSFIIFAALLLLCVVIAVAIGKSSKNTAVVDSVTKPSATEAPSTTQEPTTVKPPNTGPRVLMGYNEYGDVSVFGNASYKRSEIVSIEFLASMAGKPSAGAWDVSVEQDGSVFAWVDPVEGGYALHIAADGKIIANTDCTCLFSGAYHKDEETQVDWFIRLKSIDFNGVLDTSNVTNMKRMFKGCKALQTLDLRSFDTSNVTNMGAMFNVCESLQTLDLSGFDTSNVTDMDYLFSGCHALTSVNVSSFDTSKVTNMEKMFFNCYVLQTLDLSGFDTSKVTSMEDMFHNCKALQSLDLRSFDTSKVTNMNAMFNVCESLQTLDLSGFDTSNVTDMGYLFSGCHALTSVNVSSFDTSKVTNMEHMFHNCKALQTLDLRSFSSQSLEKYDDMFTGTSCEVLVDSAKFTIPVER